MNEEKIARINALYHKSKAEGLTPEEKEEQQKLRKEYIEAIRGNMRATLDHTSIQNQDGTLTPLRIVRQKNLAMKNAGNKIVDITGDNINISSDEIDSDKVETIEEVRQKKLTEDKKRIRKELTERRNDLTKHEVNQRSGIICNHVLMSEQYKNADNICIYKAFRNEVSCDDIVIRAYEDKKHVYAPVVDMDKRTMNFYEITEKTEWNEGSYGIMEPVVCSDNKILMNSDNALIIMPGLAFNKNKHRIGYGGGYYDKYLVENDDHITMALCYSFQVIDKELPQNEDDVIPDYIVTENGII